MTEKKLLDPKDGSWVEFI